MFSTHYPAPHRPTERALRMLDILARQAADLIEREKSEQSLRHLGPILQSTDDAVIGLDLNERITAWNGSAEKVLGYSAAEAIGRPVTILIPPERHEAEREYLQRVRVGEHVDHYETVRRRKDGTLVDVELTVSPVLDAAGRQVGASKIARDISERKRAQERQELLAREIQHRTKNLFAVVQAVVGRSFAGKQTVKDAEATVVSRLASLAQTHVMLMDKQWEGLDLAEVISTEMSPYAGRVKIEGPQLTLNPKAAQNFSLAVHELATNAAKYGALSNATGWVHIQLVDPTRWRRCMLLPLAGTRRATRHRAEAQGLRQHGAGVRDGRVFQRATPDGVRAFRYQLCPDSFTSGDCSRRMCGPRRGPCDSIRELERAGPILSSTMCRSSRWRLRADLSATGASTVPRVTSRSTRLGSTQSRSPIGKTWRCTSRARRGHSVRARGADLA